jgi:hypothetical protein
VAAARATVNLPCVHIPAHSIPGHLCLYFRPQYFDAISDPRRPFQLGFVLHRLSYGSGAGNTDGAATAAEHPARSNADGVATLSRGRGSYAGPSAAASVGAAAARVQRFQQAQLTWDGAFVYINSLTGTAASSDDSTHPLTRNRSASTAAASTTRGHRSNSIVDRRLTDVFGWTRMDIGTLQLVLNDVSSISVARRRWLHLFSYARCDASITGVRCSQSHTACAPACHLSRRPPCTLD